MKVDRIQHYINQWKDHLLAGGDIPNAFYAGVVNHWQQHWDIEHIDFGTMYGDSLYSEVSARLWGGSTNSAKSMMSLMIGEQKEFVRSTFRDLYNENLDLGLRLDRFAYHCDQILAVLQRRDSRYSTHYHDDRKLPCLYLALEKPDMYCLWDYAAFERMMTLVESRNTPLEVEMERYYKSCRAIFNFIKKDEELMSLIAKRCGQDQEHLGLIVMNFWMEYLYDAQQPTP